MCLAQTLRIWQDEDKKTCLMRFNSAETKAYFIFPLWDVGLCAVIYLYVSRLNDQEVNLCPEWWTFSSFLIIFYFNLSFLWVWGEIISAMKASWTRTQSKRWLYTVEDSEITWWIFLYLPAQFISMTFSMWPHGPQRNCMTHLRSP